jgi:hypothetical protein
MGSLFDTVLAVYHETNLLNLPSAHIVSDNNGAPDGIRSLVQFSATAGLKYLAVVDGVRGAKGPAQIHWQLGRGPELVDPSAPASNLTVRIGSELDLEVAVASAEPAPDYHWYWNGHLVSVSTSNRLVLSDLQSSQAGNYSVVVSNFAGSVTQVMAVVTVDALHFLNYRRTEGGIFAGQLLGNPGQGFAVEVSSDLQDWKTLSTGEIAAPSEPFEFLDPHAPQVDRRFYRVRPAP